MQADIEEQQVDQNLFQVLESGDSRIAKANSKGIFFLGLTRAGKSTVFNWILQKPMKGVAKGKHSRSVVYELINPQEEGVAELGSSFTSVTLAPNVFPNYDNTKETTLIDMAGYGDSRNYVGVIGVSYFLRAVFSKVRKAKFVIVFNEATMNESTG